VGVVVRTGRMDKTVSVRVPKRRWEPRIKKVWNDLLSIDHVEGIETGQY
jgi:ribosomal protein S17